MTTIAKHAFSRWKVYLLILALLVGTNAISAFDAHKNFARSLVATAPSPATSGTSLVVTAADGSKFPAVPFNATIGPANTLLTQANSEIVRVTNISTDTFTITRAQESSSARTVVVGDQIFAAATVKAFTDLETGVDATMQTTTSTGTQNDFSTGFTFASGRTYTLRVNNASLVTFRGFSGGVDGATLCLVSIGAGQVNIDGTSANTSSTAANRTVTYAVSGVTPLSAGVGTACETYDGTTSRWRLVSHEQGDWIDYGPSSTIVGSASWGTSSILYYLHGRHLSVSYFLSGTSNSTGTTFTMPFTSRTASGVEWDGAMGLDIDAGAYSAQPGGSQVTNNSTTVTLYSQVQGRVAWTASGTKQIAGQFMVDVQ